LFLFFFPLNSPIINFLILVPTSQSTIDKAIVLASDYGLSAMDSLHVATAIEGKADEFLTFEKPTKPFFLFHHQNFVLFPWLKILLSHSQNNQNLNVSPSLQDISFVKR
jgi:hypothetical protein